jgi:hypothetical protein
MAFPKIFDELKPAGYKFDGEGTCKGCGDEIEWWQTPSGKKIPMNQMAKGSDAATPHWQTCTEADSFRK